MLECNCTGTKFINDPETKLCTLPTDQNPPVISTCPPYVARAVNSSAPGETLRIPELGVANYSAFDIDSPPVKWSFEPSVPERLYVIGDVMTVHATALDQSNLSSQCTTQVSVMVATSPNAPDDFVYHGSRLRPANFLIDFDVRGSSPKGDGSLRYAIDNAGLGRDLDDSIVICKACFFLLAACAVCVIRRHGCPSPYI